MRTRAEIERDIAEARKERRLYVSPHGVDGCHAKIDRLLDEWEAASWSQDVKSPQATPLAPSA